MEGPLDHGHIVLDGSPDPGPNYHLITWVLDELRTTHIFEVKLFNGANL